MKLKITANGHPHEVVVDKVTGEYKVTIDGQIYKCVFKDNGLHINGEHFPIEVEGRFDETDDGQVEQPHHAGQGGAGARDRDGGAGVQ